MLEDWISLIIFVPEIVSLRIAITFLVKYNIVVGFLNKTTYLCKKLEHMNELMDDDKNPKKPQKSEHGTPVLDNFSRDLIKLAEQNKLDPVIGREKEILRIAQILSRRKKNNPIIIGEPGAGKTAIAEGLAMKILCSLNSSAIK